MDAETRFCKLPYFCILDLIFKIILCLVFVYIAEKTDAEIKQSYLQFPYRFGYFYGYLNLLQLVLFLTLIMRTKQKKLIQIGFITIETTINLSLATYGII